MLINKLLSNSKPVINVNKNNDDFSNDSKERIKYNFKLNYNPFTVNVQGKMMLENVDIKFLLDLIFKLKTFLQQSCGLIIKIIVFFF